MILPSSERDYNTLVDPLRWSQQSIHKFVPRMNIASEAGNICYIKNCSPNDEVSSFSDAILKKGIAVKSIERIKVGPNKEPTYTIRAIVPKSADRELLIKEGIYANYEHHRIEAHVKSAIRQCFKCQEYGHLSADCKNGEKNLKKLVLIL